MQPPVVEPPWTGPWVENPKNWQQCVDHTKEFAEKNFVWKPIPYPQGNLASVNGCVVILVGSHSNYQEDFKRGLRNFDTYFNDMYHYPIYAFHFNLNEEAQRSIQASSRSNITFLPIARPLATDPVSVLNPTPIMENNAALYSFPLEYRFQSYFFLETIFTHPAVKDYTYVLRIDNDIDLLAPITYDPFYFMERTGIVIDYHHWSMDPWEICNGIYKPTYLYQEQMTKWTDLNRDRTIPPMCYCGGGALFTAYAPFFRSPQFLAYWEFIKCLGGIWTNRWAEQNLIPIILSLIADRPERRVFALSNFAVNHRQGALQPHASWGVPTWPYMPENLDKTITHDFNAPPKHFHRGCVVYYTTTNDIEQLRRSLTNLEWHFLWEFNYPIYIFHSGLSLDQEKYIATAVANQYTKIHFVKVDMSKEVFLLRGMFEQDELAQYGYFLRLDSRTNIIADVHFDLFKFMEDNEFLLTYHRWHSPEPRLEPPANDQLWELTTKEYPTKTKQLPPVNFYFSLQYFALGSFDFFRSEEYKAYVKKLPDTASTSMVFPLAISLFEGQPWKRISDITQLMINWDTKSNDPFYHKAWWNIQEPIPTWGYKYSNRAPPSVEQKR